MTISPPSASPADAAVPAASAAEQRGHPSPSSSAATGAYHPALDGMRAVGMAMMLAYHAGFSFARGAFLSLSQFFTLSGYLITSMLLRSHLRGGIDLRRFWTRRFQRLLPAAVLGLLVAVVFGATAATRQQAENLPQEIAAAAANGVNWWFIVTKSSYVKAFGAPSPIQHYWSLSVEEQFYLVFPLLLLLLLRRTRSLRAIGAVLAGGVVASTAWMAWLYRSGAGLDRLYYGTDTRMAEILLGGVLATVFTATGTDFSAKTRRTLGLVGLVAYAVSAWATFAIPLADGPMWQGGFLLFAGLSILSIAGLVSGGGPLPRLLGWAPLAATGRITYGLYVYHLPIFLWLTEDRTGLSQWPLFGVRVVVTFVVAILSYHVIEMPIRQGALSRLPTRVRLASAPACVAVVVLLGFVAVDRNAPDPFATLAGGDHSLTAPVTPDDGVLDLLVITDVSGGPVVDRLAEAARGDDTVRVVRAEPFRCDRLVPAGTGSVCANWKTEWTRLIRDDDPDLVLLYLDAWEPSDLSRLSGIPVAETGQLTAAAQTYLDAGLDILTARGARVLWSPAGADFATQLARSTTPLHQAMANLEPRRDDLRHVLGTRLPDPKATTREQFLDRSAAALVADASLYQRATADRLPRIMVVGDSQARSLGFGLERWAAAGGHAVVWNVATEGCGLAVEGAVEGFGGESGVATRCRDAVQAYARQVEEFDPDLVVVLTSLWDLRDRRWPGSGRMLAAGTGDFDRHLVLEYERAVRTLTSGGAHVTWMTVPCTGKMRADDGAVVTVADITPAQIRAMNEDVLPRVERAFPAAVTLFPLDDVLCPSGRPRDDIDGVSPVRVDGVHFSVEGAEWFARRYGDRLLEQAGR